MSARKAKPQHAPRRKAGSNVAPKAKRKLRFRLVIDAQEIIVDYTPNWSEGEYAQGHFEFKSPFEPPRRTILSETGYYSHFVSMAQLKEFASPNAYATELALSVLRSKPKGKPRLGDQLSLF